VTKRMWPERLWEKVLLLKEPRLRAAAYRRAARQDLLGEAEDLFLDAVTLLWQMLREGARPFDREPSSSVSGLLDAYEQAAARGDRAEAAWLEGLVLDYADKAVRCQYLLTGSLRKASRRRRAEALRAETADALRLRAGDTPDADGARERLGRLLRDLAPKDAVALVAYRFRDDPGERDAVCHLVDESLRTAVESAVTSAGEGDRPLGALKKRYQRALVRARALEVRAV
jgi:hypothetical protein